MDVENTRAGTRIDGLPYISKGENDTSREITTQGKSNSTQEGLDNSSFFIQKNGGTPLINTNYSGYQLRGVSPLITLY